MSEFVRGSATTNARGASVGIDWRGFVPPGAAGCRLCVAVLLAWRLAKEAIDQRLWLPKRTRA